MRRTFREYIADRSNCMFKGPNENGVKNRRIVAERISQVVSLVDA